VRLAVHREFEVPVSSSRAWDHLARIESWPSWAKHIREVEVDPPGPLTSHTSGIIRLTNGITSRFVMTDLGPPRHWTWEGKFLWMRIRYDHGFEALALDRTRIRFQVFVGGLGQATLGRLFARIYAKNLDRAIPNLVAELSGASAAASPATRGGEGPGS
jgi:hypothetical protein